MIGVIKMDCFNYPLDTKTLYRKKARIKRELSEQSGLIIKKIAVLGGVTINEVVDLNLKDLLRCGISWKKNIIVPLFRIILTDLIIG